MDQILKQILDQLQAIQSDINRLKSDISDLKTDVKDIKLTTNRIEGSQHQDVQGMLNLIKEKIDTMASKEEIDILATEPLHTLKGRLSPVFSLTLKDGRFIITHSSSILS